jgi:lipopolysaccharide heptosyltransferase I
MNRILIVRLSALGDIVHALPVLSAIRSAFPAAQIDWLAEAAYAGILDLVDGLNEPIVVRPGYVRALATMRSRRYDAAIDLQGLFKSAVAARLSGARRVIGFETAALREKGAAWFYSEQAPMADAVHVIQKNLSVLPLLGVKQDPIASVLPLSPTFPFRASRSRVIDHVTSLAPNGFALINPGAAWPNKRWPPERFGAVARRLRDAAGLRPVVLWGAREAPLADAVVAASDGAATRAPETTLADLIALSREARLMVSGDTGPIHLAAAVGTPIVGLYGPTWPARNGPWHPDDEVVSRAESCECHHKRQCQRALRCIDDIGVDEVIAAIERRLRKVTSR